MVQSIQSVLAELERLAEPSCRDRLSSFGNNPAKALGLTMQQLHKLAKSLERAHELARWERKAAR